MKGLLGVSELLWTTPASTKQSATRSLQSVSFGQPPRNKQAALCGSKGLLRERTLNPQVRFRV